ncbi:MAG: hypothetical protein ACOYMG_27865, partial [Candidatus Methylumidiphilus sp.]
MSFRPYLRCVSIISSLVLCPAIAGSAFASSLDSWDYQLGNGFRLGNSGVWLGGYGVAVVHDYQNQPWEFELDDLSLFIGYERGRWRFFSELELGDSLQASNGNALNTRHAYFDLERLYADYLFNDVVKVRAGKFLTPIGRWNLIHAAPLVWTTSTPLIVQVPFAMHQTGGMAYGHFMAYGRQLSYAVYGSGASELDFGDNDDRWDDNYRDTFGLRLYQEIPGQFQMGASFAHYTERFVHPGQKNLVGLDLFWAHRHFE